MTFQEFLFQAVQFAIGCAKNIESTVIIEKEDTSQSKHYILNLDDAQFLLDFIQQAVRTEISEEAFSAIRKKDNHIFLPGRYLTEKNIQALIAKLAECPEFLENISSSSSSPSPISG